MSTEELFIRSGLAKSAFARKIHEPLSWMHYIPYVQEVQRLCRAAGRFLPKVYQAHDALLMFLKPYESVYPSLKKSNKAAPVWHAIVKEAVNSEDFLRVNSFTQNSFDLASVAAYQFLREILGSLKDLERKQEELKRQQQTQQGQQVQVDLKALFGQKAEDAIRNAVHMALEKASEYKENAETAEVALQALVPVGGGFSKEALSVLSFLQNPDEFRRKVRLLKFARVFFQRFMASLPVSFAHEQAVSQYGGLHGVGRMSGNHLSDILPSELALLSLQSPAARALFATKFASRQLLAYLRAAAVKPVIFVDKSGSMADNFWRGEGVPKISAAAGLALALYRKYGVSVYLFDTEITAVKPSDVVKTLLTVRADGGTDVDVVLEEIVRLGKEDFVYIVVSDGITEASPEILKRFEASGLAKRTKLILIPPAASSYNWVAVLKRHGNVHFAEDVASFEKAAKQALG